MYTMLASKLVLPILCVAGRSENGNMPRLESVRHRSNSTHAEAVKSTSMMNKLIAVKTRTDTKDL